MSIEADTPDNHQPTLPVDDGSTVNFHPLHAEAALATHSRPALPVHTPATVDHAILLVGEVGRGQGEPSDEDDRTRFIKAIDKRGWTIAQKTGSEVLAVSPPHAIKWERHTEFIALTSFVMHGSSGDKFGDQGIDFDGLLADLAGVAQHGTEVFARMRVSVAQEDNAAQDDKLSTQHSSANVSLDQPDAVSLENGSPTEGSASGRRSSGGRTDPVPDDTSLIKVLVNGDAICVATDLRHDAKGVVRYRATLSRQMTSHLPPARIGRFVQRLLEIESYRLLAYLAVPKTQEMGARVSKLEGKVNRIAERTAAEPKPDEEAAILTELTSLSAELQSIGSASEFRFAASLAYSAIVNERLGQLRESRIEAYQRLSVAIKRRLDPAMRSCEALLARQQKIAERIGNITELLRTRVDLTLQDQNSVVLRSIDARADAQLRLQQTVEGLSVAAITYYLLGIIDYLVKGTPVEMLGLSQNSVQAVIVIPVVLLVYFRLKKARDKADAQTPENLDKKDGSGPA